MLKVKVSFTMKVIPLWKRTLKRIQNGKRTFTDVWVQR